MPYIKKEDRERFVENYGSDIIDEIGHDIKNCGELNYVITKICHAYLSEHGKRYQYINDIIGALEGAKLELYRRIASSYEDEKIKENGDVMEC